MAYAYAVCRTDGWNGQTRVGDNASDLAQQDVDDHRRDNPGHDVSVTEETSTSDDDTKVASPDNDDQAASSSDGGDPDGSSS